MAKIKLMIDKFRTLKDGRMNFSVKHVENVGQCKSCKKNPRAHGSSRCEKCTSKWRKENGKL